VDQALLGSNLGRKKDAKQLLQPREYQKFTWVVGSAPKYFCMMILCMQLCPGLADQPKSSHQEDIKRL
jgi:hypothetical protein